MTEVDNDRKRDHEYYYTNGGEDENHTKRQKIETLEDNVRSLLNTLGEEHRHHGLAWLLSHKECQDAWAKPLVDKIECDEHGRVRYWLCNRFYAASSRPVMLCQDDVRENALIAFSAFVNHFQHLSRGSYKFLHNDDIGVGKHPDDPSCIILNLPVQTDPITKKKVLASDGSMEQIAIPIKKGKALIDRYTLELCNGRDIALVMDEQGQGITHLLIQETISEKERKDSNADEENKEKEHLLQVLKVVNQETTLWVNHWRKLSAPPANDQTLST